MTGLLTARQVGELLGVTPETVLRWTRAGELPAIRLPGTARGRLRFRVDEVDRWLEEHATGAAPREVSATRDGRAHAEGYGLGSSASATPPPRAATTEED